MVACSNCGRDFERSTGDDQATCPTCLTASQGDRANPTVGETAVNVPYPNDPPEREDQSHCCDIGPFHGDGCCCNNLLYYTRCKKPDKHDEESNAFFRVCLPCNILFDVLKLVFSPLIWLFAACCATCFFCEGKDCMHTACRWTSSLYRQPAIICWNCCIAALLAA